MRPLPDATIIVLNWNGQAYLESCLSALLSQTVAARRLVLADNDSTDESIALVREKFPMVEILENNANLGYAGGNNAALRMVNTEIAVLVNPDIVVEADWLAHLMAAFTAKPDMGVAGCKLLYPDGKQLQHAGGIITHPLAMPGHRGMYEKDDGQFTDAADVDFVTGAAMAVSRAMMEEVGLLDEGFFMYFEDADWCTRARRHGYRVIYVPEALAIHDESALAVRGSLSYLRRFHSGRWRYLLKHFDPAEIVDRSLPEEVRALALHVGWERQALAWAYHHTLKQLPAIMATRLKHGATAIPAAAQELIELDLQELRREAMLWPSDPNAQEWLAEAGRVTPQPFSSHTPLFGPLFARLRDLWAGVAAKPFVGALNAQQNALNQAFIEELSALEQRMMALRQVWLERETDQRQVHQELAAIEEELFESQRLLQSIEARLARLEASREEAEHEL